MKYLFVIFLFILNINAQEFETQKQENVLKVKALIEQEEEIAEKFEKYILTEFSFPTLDNLISDDYLGSNFSVINSFGNSISFKTQTGTLNRLELNYAVTKNVDYYVKELYERDLYRLNTFLKKNSDLTSTIKIKLKSPEAINIYKILESGATIAKTCSDTLKSSYCNQDIETIRWYNSASNWIEYSKKDFEDGNVTIVSTFALTDTKLNNLKVGAYIYIENSSKYVKMIDNKILKVE